MEFNFNELPPKDRYRLLCNFVGPRPIALVTTMCRDGRSNAAPMSFFNVFSQDPPIVILGIQAKQDGTPKDTTVNIRETGEFVVNMVDMGIADQMITCGLNFPRDVDEVEKAGLTLDPSLQVRPGRILEAPCSMECRLHQSIEFPRRSIILGQVVQMHVRNDCIDDAGRYVRPDVYHPIARLHADNYIVADQQFVLKPTETV
jgi:flavin reductase (DIM6/NTAB) family NADH-FMN oxidoreductase RutF